MILRRKLVVHLLLSVGACLLPSACCRQLRQSASDSVISYGISKAAASCQILHKACTRCTSNPATGLFSCSACARGWRLRTNNGSESCECAPGRHSNGTTCSICPMGYYCTESSIKDCPDGLATVITGARNPEQCMTTPGWGRILGARRNGSTLIRSQLCPVGTYNEGGNSGPCKQCPPGSTTKQLGASSKADCVAPPGSYLPKTFTGAAVKCPKGTYTDDYNTDPACKPCRTGTTTANEGSTAADDCSLAMPGFYLQPVDELSFNTTGMDNLADVLATAVVCSINTYQDNESATNECTPCPNGLRTEDEGATGIAMCMASPGMQLLPGATNISECPIGYYKEGWNNNMCTPCGEGLETATTGAVDKDACFVPAGYGILTDVMTRKPVATMCVSNTYGNSKPSYDISTTKCIPCPQGTATEDVQTGIAATAGYTSSSDCMPLPGYGMSRAGNAELCPVGSWSAGLHQRTCQLCPSGYTTLGQGSASSKDCVVQPGWAATTSETPQPCSKGTYSEGGSAITPNAECKACPTGFTTQDDAATSSSDCNVCSAGYGGPACEECPYGTYSFGGSTEACRPCAAGSTSARRAGSASDCVLTWPQEQDSHDVDLYLSNDSAWTRKPEGDRSKRLCKSQCTDGCIMYHYTLHQAFGDVEAADATQGDEEPGNPKGVCQVLMHLTPESPGYADKAAIGFKAFAGGAVVDYAFYYMPQATTLGELLQDVGAVKLAACLQACNRREDCMLVRVIGSSNSSAENAANAKGNPDAFVESQSLTSCKLYTAPAAPGVMSSYQIAPQHLLSDGFVVDT